MNKIIPIWKDKGITSYDLIRKIKKNVKGVKIGHCGTLDPFAEGMMLICTGNKTKQVQEIMEYDKIYETKIPITICPIILNLPFKPSLLSFFIFK